MNCLKENENFVHVFHGIVKAHYSKPTNYITDHWISFKHVFETNSCNTITQSPNNDPQMKSSNRPLHSLNSYIPINNQCIQQTVTHIMNNDLIMDHCGIQHPRHHIKAIIYDNQPSIAIHPDISTVHSPNSP